ncbi:hypothetical protein QYE76_030920 [Lolium multiflorum]|uniref:SIAH-type domain-containing protein n=1 Tax=Lolium multiflorum TaxID=4521 RepID=A0AAD8VGX1_LOLMU|nr:hypothetical protein QYE76_030920 [Lolium multiflorum]
MDGTMEINATNLEAIAYNIAGTAQVMCSHDGCGVIVSYHESLSHQIACPHGRCNCTEQGCDFAAPPSALLVHLAEAHSIQVHRLEYGKSIEFRVTMTHPCSPCRLLVVEGDDGSVFVLYIDALGPAIVLSLLLFSAVFGFRNPSKEIFSNWTKLSPRVLFLHEASKTEEITKWGHEAARARAARPRPWPRRPTPWAPRVAPALTFRLLKASVAKPRTESHDTENLPETPPPRIPSRGIQEIASGTLPERGFISRRTLHRHGRLRSDE